MSICIKINCNLCLAFNRKGECELDFNNKITKQIENVAVKAEPLEACYKPLTRKQLNKFKLYIWENNE